MPIYKIPFSFYAMPTSDWDADELEFDLLEAGTLDDKTIAYSNLTVNSPGKAALHGVSLSIDASQSGVKSHSKGGKKKGSKVTWKRGDLAKGKRVRQDVTFVRRSAGVLKVTFTVDSLDLKKPVVIDIEVPMGKGKP